MSWDDEDSETEAALLHALDCPRAEALTIFQSKLDNGWRRAPRTWLATMLRHQQFRDDDRVRLATAFVGPLTRSALD